MKKLILLLGLFIMPSAANAADAIVDWNTLKVTSDYNKQVRDLKENESLIVWVGYTNLDLFTKLRTANNCYVESLPGTPSGLLIGKKQNGQANIVQTLGNFTLTDDRVTASLVATYARKTIEQQLLGQKEEPYPLRNISSPVVLQDPFTGYTKATIAPHGYGKMVNLLNAQDTKLKRMGTVQTESIGTNVPCVGLFGSTSFG